MNNSKWSEKIPSDGIASEEIKYLGINLTKVVQILYFTELENIAKKLKRT